MTDTPAKRGSATSFMHPCLMLVVPDGDTVVDRKTPSNCYLLPTLNRAIAVTETDLFNTPERRSVVIDRLDYEQTLPEFQQDHSERYDYVIDVRRWLEGDSIESVVWESDDGILLDGEEANDSQARVWASGGLANTRYKIDCLIQTKFGRRHKIWFYLFIKNEDE